jgi:class 3 adenylate cyclase/esterase/lipase
LCNRTLRAELKVVALAPEVKFTKTSDGLYLAYDRAGSDELDMIEISNGTLFSIDATREQPRWQAYVDRLRNFATLIRFDLRGIGLSDPLRTGERPSVEQWGTDAITIMDAERIDEAVILGVSFGGLGALFLSASHPDRTRAIVLVNAYASALRKDDYPFGIPLELFQRFRDELIEPDAEGQAEDLPTMAPSLADDPEFRAWWRRAGHRGASPATARAMFEAAATDVRPLLGSVRAPTLVIHARDNAFVPVGHGRYLADHIEGARYVELPTADHVPWASEADVIGEIEEFLTGARHVPVTDRLLATVMFTDIVGSAEHAAALGDQRYSRRLELHDQAVRRQLELFGGRLIKTTGDGALATFDAPARAVRCAGAIRDAARQIGFDVRIGIHTGEVEQRGEDIAGVAVITAARVQALAQPGEVLVSRTVVDLVAGSGIEFDDRGEHLLKGVPGTWRLFAVRGG